VANDGGHGAAVCHPSRPGRVGTRMAGCTLGRGVRSPRVGNGDGASTVEMLDPQAALGIVGDNPAIATVAREARARVQRALDRLGAGLPTTGR